MGRARAAHKTKGKNFSSLDSLQPVVNVASDAAMALDDKTRIIQQSAVPEVVAGTL